MPKRPNFVFILSDDQGYWSLGSYGNNEVQTPVLDRMAAEGTRFDSFYCASPVCSPARASILTGQMPSQHGVLDWLGGGSVYKKDYESLMLPRQLILENLAEDVTPDEIDPDAELLPFSLTRNFRRYMKNENVPIAYLHTESYTDYLARAGYRCGLSGKWHLGNGIAPQSGFSFWSVIPRGGTPYTMPDWYCDGEVHVGTEYVTDLITDEAIRFLKDQDADTPFYLGVHYTAPHDPWRKGDHPEEIWQQYDDCPFDTIPNEPLHEDQVMKRPHPDSPERLREMAQAYYSSITAMDGSIGRLLAQLKAQGLYEDTIVVFTSDNGMNFGHHGIWGKGNGTYPMNLYETSVKIPCIFWYGGGPGRVVHTPLSHYDLFPTLLDLAGVAPADDGTRPGHSFAPLLQGAPEQEREVVVCDEYGPVRMIRRGPWKLIWNYLDDTGHLFDLEHDPDERNDLFGEPLQQPRIQELHEAMEDWFRRYSAADFDARQYPVNGEGQMRPAPDWYDGKTVFVTTVGAPIIYADPDKKETPS